MLNEKTYISKLKRLHAVLDPAATYPIVIDSPQGKITLQYTRQDIEYWLKEGKINSKGCMVYRMQMANQIYKEYMRPERQLIKKWRKIIK